MKTTISVVCAAVLIFLVQTGNAHGPHRFLHKLEKASDECQKDPATHVDTDTARKFLTDESIDKSVYGAYVVCVSDKLGYQKANGEPDATVIKADINAVTEDQQKADAFYDKCSVQKNGKEETARAIYVCFHNLVTEYAATLFSH